jgi:AAA+ ATPase superfamily predicted ATPase
MRNYKLVKDILKRDYQTYSGIILEKYFIQKLSEENNFSQIGSYWETGNQNEIDIVAINEYEKYALIAEVKRQKKHINMQLLKEKATTLSQKLSDYKIDYKAFSLEDM